MSNEPGRARRTERRPATETGTQCMSALIVEIDEPLRKTVRNVDTVLEPEPPQTLFARHYWATSLMKLEKCDELEKLFKRTIELGNAVQLDEQLRL